MLFNVNLASVFDFFLIETQHLCPYAVCNSFSLLWLSILCQVGPQLVCLGRPANTDVNTLVSPLCKTRPPKANVLIRKVEWTRLFGFMGVMYRTYEEQSHYIYV